MRVKQYILIVIMLFLASNLGMASGITEIGSIESKFAENQMTMENYFDKDLRLNSNDELDFQEEIYDSELKSPSKAFFFSLAVPGAGQYYLGNKYRAISFLAADALLWTGYIMFNGKGNDKEDEFQNFADGNYSWENYLSWWNTLDTTDQNAYSHRLPVDENGDPIFNHEYYENIGKYDQFQVGWPNGQNHPPPPQGEQWVSVDRAFYLNLRKQSNDAFDNAKTTVKISIVNHLISAFEAAIGAKKYNKGGQQYSFRMKSLIINDHHVPLLTFNAKF